MYMLVSIASALVSVYACMLGCMYVCELGGSFAGGSPSLAIIYNVDTILPKKLGNLPYQVNPFFVDILRG